MNVISLIHLLNLELKNLLMFGSPNSMLNQTHSVPMILMIVTSKNNPGHPVLPPNY